MRTRALGTGPCTVVASLALIFASWSARAQSEPRATAVPPALSASAVEGDAAGGLRAGWLQRRSAALSSLRVIELPDESPPGARARRPHHALTWRNDTLSRSLDDMGLTNADCRNRVRLPSRLRQSPDGGAAVQVQLQIALSCSF
jgi:hypothetical protein